MTTYNSAGSRLIDCSIGYAMLDTGDLRKRWMYGAVLVVVVVGKMKPMRCDSQGPSFLMTRVQGQRQRQHTLTPLTVPDQRQQFHSVSFFYSLLLETLRYLSTS